MKQEDTFDLNGLCARVGVTPRTVRYYIQRGLLPSPGRHGPGTQYGPRHLHRLQLIRKLQRQHLPLAEIRKQLDQMDDAAVAAAVADPAPAEQPAATNDALDYIRSVRRSGVATAQVSPPKALAAPSATSAADAAAFPRERSQWERFTLTEDIELHVRRPLSRDHNRRLERLIEAAKRIFMEE